MKIYTKTGDQGSTSLLGGKRVPKYHRRIEAYGTVDELIAYIGLIRDHKEAKPYQELLLRIQDHLMRAAAILAADCENCGLDVPDLPEEEITLLEDTIDLLNEDLPPMHTFILPGGAKVVSFCHVARTVCRRAERNALRIEEKDARLPAANKYLNRLSDFLFVLGRRLSYDIGIESVSWNPNGK